MNDMVRCSAPCGDVIGKRVSENCISFLGIPFAEAPIGERRFRKPVRKAKFSEAFEATKHGPKPPQVSMSFSVLPDYVKADEDCLVVNIWTPGCDEKKRPVIFWIYGGGFNTGQASESIKDGSLIAADADMVVVTIQYRLGALGFYDFSSLDSRFEANCGLWDQVMGLDWVKDNIEAFGGDPEQITALGESAGSTSIEALLSVPRLKGAFRRVIMESTCYDAYLNKQDARRNAILLLEKLGLKEDQVGELLDMPFEKLVEADLALGAEMVEIQPLKLGPMPVIDGELLVENPFDAILGGCADGTDVLIGTCKDEATMFVKEKGTSTFPYSDECFQKVFDANPSVNQEALLALYPDYPKREALLELNKDLLFYIGSLRMADRLAEHGNVYVYRVDFTPQSLVEAGTGAFHNMECMFIAGVVPMNIFGDKIEATEKFAKGIRSSFLDFAANGKPTHVEPEWPPYGKEHNVYVFDNENHVEQNPDADKKRVYETFKLYR